jgi:hypothetical protein
MSRIKPLQWDLMTVAQRFACLNQFDLSDLGYKSIWVELSWEDLPQAVRTCLRALGQ